MTYTAKIYKIVNTINDEFYIGSTKNELRVRWGGHKDYAKKKATMNGLYEMMNEFEISCFRIVLYKEIQCENREDQIRQEQLVMDELKPKLNKCNAFGQRCEHDRLRYSCKLCQGSQICEHDRQRGSCKLCKGSQICEHDKQRGQCKLCKGSQICEHDKQRGQCKLCKGSQICEHDKQRGRCKLCKGVQICEHDRRRSGCKLCNDFYCEICDKKYSSKQYLNAHKKSFHS